MLRRVVWQEMNRVSEVFTASITRATREKLGWGIVGGRTRQKICLSNGRGRGRLERRQTDRQREPQPNLWAITSFSRPTLPLKCRYLQLNIARLLLRRACITQALNWLPLFRYRIQSTAHYTVDLGRASDLSVSCCTVQITFFLQTSWE